MLIFDPTTKNIKLDSGDVLIAKQRTEVDISVDEYAKYCMNGKCFDVAYGTFDEDEGTSTAPPSQESV